MKISRMVPPAGRRGSVGSRKGPQRARGDVVACQGVRTSIVHPYGTVERSVEPCWVPSCQVRFLTETRWNLICGLTGPDEPRRMTRLFRIGVQLWDPMGSNLTLQTPTLDGV